MASATAHGDIEIGYEFPTIEHHVTQESSDRAALAHLDFNRCTTNIEWNKRARSSAPEDGGPRHADHVHDGSLIDRHWRHAGASVIRCSRAGQAVEVGGWCAARDT